MRDGIILRIRTGYEKFSKNQKILANYILQNPSEVAFISINEFAGKVQISPATITRFVRKAGYESYAEFQKALYEESSGPPFAKFKTMLKSRMDENDPEDALRWSISNGGELLNKLYTPKLQQAFFRSTQLLLKSDKIYIAGQRSSYTAAYYLAFMFQQMRENVHLVSLVSTAFPTEFIDITPKDCLVLVSYSRYTAASFKIASCFNKIGCEIIAITDSTTSPIALKATEVLVVPNGENFSPLNAIAVCDGFIRNFAQHNTEKVLKRMEQQDLLAAEQDVYI